MFDHKQNCSRKVEITTQDIVNFRNPMAEVLTAEKDFTDKSLTKSYPINI